MTPCHRSGDSVRDRGFRSVGVLGLLVAVAAAACNGDRAAAPISTPLTVTADGKWMERGGTLLLHVTRAGAAVAPAAISWSVAPAGAATVSPGGAARLLDTGTVTFHALEPSASGAAAASFVVHVHRPPDILLDLHDTLSDSVRTGNRDIYRIALDGRELVRLTSGAGDNIEPAPSPSGSVVVFTTYRIGSPFLYAVALDGTDESAIASLPSPATDAAISPDGARLAFVGPPSASGSLWTSAIDGSGAAAIPGASANAIVASPTWCKAGDSLVVVTTAFANASLFVESSTSGRGRALTSGSAHDLEPACGPDGRSVVFSSTRDGDLGLFVSSGTAGSETVRRLDPSPANDGEPSWLPDGRVVFVTAVGTDSAQLAWVDPAQSDSVTVIAIAGRGSPAHPKSLLLAFPR